MKRTYFRTSDDLLPSQPYTWLASWIRLVEEIICIITLAYYTPCWSIRFWGWYHKVRWVKIMRFIDGQKKA